MFYPAIKVALKFFFLNFFAYKIFVETFLFHSAIDAIELIFEEESKKSVEKKEWGEGDRDRDPVNCHDRFINLPRRSFLRTVV